MEKYMDNWCRYIFTFRVISPKHLSPVPSQQRHKAHKSYPMLIITYLTFAVSRGLSCACGPLNFFIKMRRILSKNKMLTCKEKTNVNEPGSTSDVNYTYVSASNHVSEQRAQIFLLFVCLFYATPIGQKAIGVTSFMNCAK